MSRPELLDQGLHLVISRQVFVAKTAGTASGLPAPIDIRRNTAGHVVVLEADHGLVASQGNLKCIGEIHGLAEDA
ncbi:MAG: hypothetical protein DI589_19670 [Shinella sp.]|nr:MAG: hypothetical protein DI589_19670 [Shinella sp.]